MHNRCVASQVSRNHGMTVTSREYDCSAPSYPTATQKDKTTVEKWADTHLHTYPHTRTYVHTHTYIRSYAHTHTRTYSCMHTHTRTHTHPHPHTHTHTHTHTQTRTHTHTNTHTRTESDVIYAHVAAASICWNSMNLTKYPRIFQTKISRN